MKKRIEITATGCHDCELCNSNFRCIIQQYEYDIVFVDDYFNNKTFHPDCPMEPVEEN